MDTLIPIVEILMIYVGMVAIYGFVRGSTGEGALKGVVVIIVVMFVGFYFIAASFKFYRLELLMGKVFEYLLFGLIVIFQPELRRGVVRLGQNRFFGRIAGVRGDFVKVLGQAVFRLARQKVGALIVIERGVGLGNYADRATLVDAQVSPELLDSVFHPGSALHDGGVIIRDARLVAAGCLFPLTENIEVSKRLGTRHRAAIGISEESDAIAIAVSEETGNVSMAVRGELLQDLARDAFETNLRAALEDRFDAAGVKEGGGAV